MKDDFKKYEFKFLKNAWWNLLWAYKSLFHGQWIEFDEFREYNIWDPIKNIDWKRSAKSNKLYIKEFEEERDLSIIFLIDIWKSMKFGSKTKRKLELLKDIFFSIAFSASKNNDNVWAILYDDEIQRFISPKRGESNILTIINSINELNNKSYNNSNTSNVISHINKMNIRNSLLFVLTDDLENIDKNNLKLAWLENDIIYINIFDYMENNLDPELWDIVLGTWKEKLNINLKNIEKTEEYRELRMNKILDFKNKLRKNNIYYIMLDSESNIYQELLRFFLELTNYKNN